MFVNFFWFDILMFLLNVHIISSRLLNGRIHVKRAIVAFLLILPFIALALLFQEDPLADIFIICAILLSYFAPLFTLKDIKKIKIIYISLLYFGASSTFIISCRWILLIFTDDIFIRIIADVIIHGILLAVCILFSRNSVFYRAKQYIDLISMKLKILLLVSVWVSDFFALSISSYAIQHPRTFSLTLSELSAAALIILGGIMWPFIIVGNSLSASYKAALNSLDGQMQSQLKQYEFMIKANESIRKFKHDFDNVKVGLVSHLQNNDSQGALRFLEEGERFIQSETISYKTGNLIADALLSEKQTIAASDNIQIIFDGLIPAIEISPIDICIILGNLLDNAMEACAKLPETKIIAVSSNVNNGFLFLEVSNPVKDNIPIHGNIPDTTKDDKENHGMGLISVQSCMQKYDGEMELSCMDKMFTVKISIYLKS